MPFILLIISYISMTSNAFAYIDPGSGSAIMSVIIGFFVSIGVMIKIFWYKIKNFFGFTKDKKIK